MKSWNNRIDKGAFFGTIMKSYFGAPQDHVLARQILLDLAIDHPEHLEANFSNCFGELTGNRNKYLNYIISL